MVIFKETTELNPVFPFRMDRFLLKKENNTEESFHYHDYCEITYVEHGSGQYFVNGVKYEMNPGDLIIFNQVEPHGWIVTGDEMQVLVVMFAPELILDPTDILNADYLKPFAERGSNFHNKVDATDQNTARIYQMMMEAFEEYTGEELGFRYVIKADTLRMLTYLIRYYQNTKDSLSQRESLTDKKKAMKRLEEAFHYINAHFSEKITLEEVANLVYMSPNYFSGYFRKVTNKTFSEYVTKLRLKKASDLAQATDMSMSAIAMECGFRNMSNFYRLYKKHIGELPNKKK
ncbi:MAG: AraC family transcriptional regulator [Lachnospiraceae bacterium]